MDTRHSTSGYIILVNGSPVSWKSTKQSVVALSSAEAEYVSLSTTAREVCWIRRLYAELSQAQQLHQCLSINPTTIFSDSTAAIALVQKDNVNARTKHISVRYHFIKNLYNQHVISLSFVRSELQLADILTKPVNYKTVTTIIPRLLCIFDHNA